MYIGTRKTAGPRSLMMMMLHGWSRDFILYTVYYNGIAIDEPNDDPAHHNQVKSNVFVLSALAFYSVMFMIFHCAGIKHTPFFLLTRFFLACCVHRIFIEFLTTHLEPIH